MRGLLRTAYVRRINVPYPAVLRYVGNAVADAAIRVLIIRRDGNAWTRIGIAQYSCYHPIRDMQWHIRGYNAVEKMYFERLKKYRKRTIRLV
jgi:hypothetical protein